MIIRSKRETAKRNSYFGFFLLLLCSACGICLYSFFAPPTNTLCTPVGYPDGNKLHVESTKLYRFETNDPYAKVVDFYRTSNPPREDRAKKIDVDEYSIRDSGTLFVCFHILGGPLGDDVEIGCVYVRDEDGLGNVEVAWSYASTTTAGCDYMLPDIEPEDYLITP